jgi:hypothetical protein
MNDSATFLNKYTPFKMSFQQLTKNFLTMSSFAQATIICGIAAVPLVAYALLFWTGQPVKSNRSKGERAREMKQAFRSIEKSNRMANGIPSMKVSISFLKTVLVR